MECKYCKSEIENDDNFCWNCGHWTTCGYLFFKKDPQNLKMLNGKTAKQHNRMGSLITLMMLGFILFFTMMIIQGKDLFKPVFYLKKQMLSYRYGYNISLMKTDNVYTEITINSIEDAYDIIGDDVGKQDWQCMNNWDVWFIEDSLMKDYDIKSVNFCDINLEITKEIENVIRQIYKMFPNIKGYLTNITITNAKTSSEYVAYFQAINQFVNSSEDIDSFNKVNKTQILLNSYYFLNEEKLNSSIEKEVGKNWYVKDATWGSTIAHEFGHYITFVALLKSNNINNVVFVTPDNINDIDKIIENINSGIFANEVVITAYENYKTNNKLDISINDFASQISEYACSKSKDGNLLSEATIAEAVHDYYLHQNNASKSSLEIVNVLKEKLK